MKLLLCVTSWFQEDFKTSLEDNITPRGNRRCGISFYKKQWLTSHLCESSGQKLLAQGLKTELN